MRTIDKLQMLTTNRVDLNGNVIDPNVIEWEMYDANPVLLYDKKEESHKGVVVGKVLNRKRVSNGWAGNLSFMERFEDADIAYEKYSQGVLLYVSIGGYAVGEEKDGKFIVLKYRVREFSLVKFPANMDCKLINSSELSEEEQRTVNELIMDGKEVRYLTMSVNFNQTDMNENETKQDVIEVGTDETKQDVIEAGTDETKQDVIEAGTDETKQDVIEAGTDETKQDVIEAGTDETKQYVVEAAAEEKQDIAETPVKEEIINASDTPPQGMQWHERNQSQSKANIFMEKTFKELNCDADFNKRMYALNAAFRTGAKTIDNLPEHAETVKILAASMLNDEKLVILAASTHVTDHLTKARRNGLEILVNCAAGGATAATLAAADLGVIKYLSLFYEQLLANDTFRRSVRFVPMSDRTGAIYIESGINVPTYVGNVTPINTQRYFYDDIKRTIARKVFSFSPITFQHADLAVLAYDKQSTGITAAMDATMQDISTYWLQVVANTAGITKIGTSGGVVPTAGLFPIEAPSSSLNVKKPTLSDVVDLEGAFLMQNFRLERQGVEMVLPARIYSMLAADPEIRNQLTRELNANIASYINFSATRITPRNPVARVNTTTGNAELDPAMYADNAVADNGTFTAITPATTTAAHVGAGVAFVQDEVIAGIGAIELIVMPDPQNYGTTISGWVSTGATVARQNAKGVALIVPTVSA